MDGRKLHPWLLLLFLLFRKGASQLSTGRSCFCTLYSTVDECQCSIGSVDEFNNNKVFPLLQALLERNFFRYYKVHCEAAIQSEPSQREVKCFFQVDMDKPCPFWQDERMCSSEKCGIETCDSEVPDGLKQPSPHEIHEGFTNEAQECCACKDKEDKNIFDPLDSTISGSAKEKFEDWTEFDGSENKFCDMDDDKSANMHYVDLTRNPERYTGYVGKSAQLVWKSIYLENCFKPHPKFDKHFLLEPTVTGMCLEKRVFFRIISGLHASITVSIAAHNYKPGNLLDTTGQRFNSSDSLTSPNLAPGGFGQGTWVRNLDMFKWRFSAETTNREGPQRLKNLYFVYLLQLRALEKVAPYLSTEFFYTGDKKEDKETRGLVKQLISIIKEFPDHFNESEMFQGIEANARELKEEFRQHFLNISKIMDCVDCDKCRLWGKVQTHGIGAALKILLSEAPRKQSTSQKHTSGSKFQLSRNEVVALLNSFGRFASSIREIAEFRRILESQ